jgi:hypothetical protein
VTSGLSAPNIPKHLEHIEGYETISLDPKNYEGKSVLVLGNLCLFLSRNKENCFTF